MSQVRLAVKIVRLCQHWRLKVQNWEKMSIVYLKIIFEQKKLLLVNMRLTAGRARSKYCALAEIAVIRLGDDFEWIRDDIR
jgi:hypothetical protein